MPAEHAPENVRAQLLRELELVRQRIREEAAQASPGALALVRLCPELELAAWREMATAHRLTDWLALPLAGDLAPHLLHLQQLLNELAFETEHDPLTGLANRRAFERVLDLEIERTRRSGVPVSLAVFDLDDFKKVNDTYGHPAGDEVLMRVSEAITRVKRRYDLGARIGGEEFALILSGVGMFKSEEILNRLMESVRALDFTFDGEPVRVTCSVGLAVYKGRGELTARDMFEQADKALYEAKGAGKNCIRAAPLPDLAAVTPERTLVHSSEKQFLFTGSK